MFIFVDTEALIKQMTPVLQEHTLRLGHAIFIRRRTDRHGAITMKREAFDFNTIEQFWDFVESKAKKKKKLYIMALNWNYDAGILAMATVPAARGWVCERYVNEKPPVIIRLKHKKKGVIQVLDVMNYFAQSLESLGEQVGLAKGMLDASGDERISIPLEWFKIPAEDLTPFQSSRMWEYCRNDVTIIADTMMKYLEFLVEHDLGNFQPTLASQAFSAFRHRFLDQDTAVWIHDRARICELERDAYHGGRTECLFIGRVTSLLHKVDVNSLYPSVMLAERFPTKLLHDGESATINEIKGYLNKGYGIIARVKLNTDRPAYAFVDERLTFPVDRFETALCTPEIRYALDHDHVESFGEYAIYQMEPIFVEYVEHFYKLRLKYKAEGNGSYDLMTKLMMNSLYGKFGQRGEVWESLGVNERAQDEGTITFRQGSDENGPVVKERVKMGHIQRLTEEPETQDSFPGIAAHVSAYARMLLWQAIEVAGTDHCYYMDTDSLVLDPEGFTAMEDAGLIDPTALGKFKLEGSTHRSRFFNVKDYQFGDERHIKGISKKAVMIAPMVYRMAKFESWDALHSKGVDGVIYVHEQTKTLARIYKKGHVSEAGTIVPFSLTDGVRQKQESH